jgi:MSHA biogenesis protein MshK
MMSKGQTISIEQGVGEAARQLIVSGGTTDMTTSHLTNPAKNAGQVIGYSHSTRLANNASQVAGYVFCLLSSVVCCAEDLPDPTRPPTGIFAPAAGGGVGAGAGLGAWQERAQSHSSGLHTIIISETRRAAIIDGETVELGDEHGGARLIEVNEGGVVLQRAQSRQVLTLFPDVKINRKKTPDQESGEQLIKESSNEELQAKQPSSASKAQSGKHKNMPTAHDEKLLSGHPKEEK